MNFQQNRQFNFSKGKSQPDESSLQNIYTKTVQNLIDLEDLYHILYLKPFQCVLDEEKGGLAKGLKIVQRTSQTQYSLKQIKDVWSFKGYQENKKILNMIGRFANQPSNEVYNSQDSSYLDYLKQNNGDNMLSQMKSHNIIEMAICICMYNETKQMLSSTLSGVGQNIANLWKQGVDPDKIVVIIVQDGIQPINKQILQLYKILEAESGMRFDDKSTKNIRQAFETAKQMDENNRNSIGIEGQDLRPNLNQFLFSKDQQKQRNDLRFINVKKRYDGIKKLLKLVKSLNSDKSKTIVYDDLPTQAKMFFQKQCDDLIVKQNAKPKQNQKQEAFKLRYYDQIASNTKKSKPLICNALSKTIQYCDNYIKSRESMSHVSFFKTGLFFPQGSGISSDQQHQLSILKRLYEEYYAKQGKSASNNQSIPEPIKKFFRQLNLQEMSFAQIQNKLAIKMNIIFVVKYKNAQKLSSHNWFFNGFCKEFSNAQYKKKQKKQGQSENDKISAKLQKVSPRYTILLDVGLRPEGTALCKMYNVMENNEKVGGVCGYMGLKIENSFEENDQLSKKIDSISNFCLHFVDIQRAQQLEYHFAHLIDKGFQSFFKFIHVLPGAYSGYKMQAIWGKQDQNSNQSIQYKQKQNKTDQLLGNYFKSIKQKLKDKQYKAPQLNVCKILCRVLLPNIIVKLIDPVPENSHEKFMYEENVYLAEDRILCMGIHQNGFDMMFLPDAQSIVDPVKQIPTLLGQRKRWINGSFFAFEKVSDQFRQMGKCQFLDIQLWYLSIMNILAFIAPGFYLFSINVAMQVVRADFLVKLFQNQLNQQSQIYSAFVYTINFIYGLMILSLVYFSINLTNKNQTFVKYIYSLSTFLGIMSIIMMIILMVDLIKGLIYHEPTYLISNSNSTFVSNIPGGADTVAIIRYVMLGVMGLYAVPLLLYTVLFRNIKVMVQILMGVLSFTFYTPTYLIVLNTYALCRMDDLSWGTKGLDTGGGQDASVKINWKIIKTLHVAKFVFWNVLTAGLLIHFGSEYLIRFYLTFALMIIIALTMAIKVLFAVLYYIYYALCVNRSPKKKTQLQMDHPDFFKGQPSLYKYFHHDIEGSNLQKQIRSKILHNIKQRLQDLKKQDEEAVKLVFSCLFKGILDKRQQSGVSQAEKAGLINFLMQAGTSQNKQNQKQQKKAPTYTWNQTSKYNGIYNGDTTKKFDPQSSKNILLTEQDRSNFQKSKQSFLTPFKRVVGSEQFLMGDTEQKKFYENVNAMTGKAFGIKPEEEVFDNGKVGLAQRSNKMTNSIIKKDDGMNRNLLKTGLNSKPNSIKQEDIQINYMKR